MRATDAASNLGPYSNTATTTTQASAGHQAPTAPTSLSASASSSTQIGLAWTAATDNVGVTGYLLERCQGGGCSSFAQIATPTTTTFSDTGLTPSTSYSYRVRATDAATNLGPYSNTAATSTLSSGPASTPVFVTETHSATDGAGTAFNQSTLTLNVSGPNSLILLAWHAEFSGAGPDTWQVTCNGVPGTEIVNTNGYTGGAGNRLFRIYYWLNPQPGPNTLFVFNPSNTANELAVSAILLNNVLQTNPLGQITLDVSTLNRTGESETAATTPGDLVVHVIADALFTRGTLGPGETSRSVANDGDHIADGDASLWISTKPGEAGTTNVSSSGWAARVINGAGIVVHGTSDAEPPTAPANLSATPVSGTQVNLIWTPSMDNIAVAQYQVEHCQNAGCTDFAQVGTSTGTSYSDTGLTPDATYNYRVRATDGAGNLSGYSNTATATTPAGGDIQPPTAPTNIIVTSATLNQISLSWTASTDNVGVTGYRVERCQGANCTTFAQIGAVQTTAFNDSGLTAGTDYSYRVRATDGAGNLGAYSIVLNTSTLHITSALVAAYDFNEGSGTTVTDLSGRGNTGTIANATWTTAGKFGNALQFNGTNARVNINDSTSLRLTNGMTLEAWVNPSSVTSAWRDVIYKGNDNYYLEGTTTRSGSPGAGSTIGAANLTAFGTAALTVNTWTHLAETYDGTALKLYVNGALVSTVAASGSIATSANQLQIGGDSIFGQYFAGKIDEIRIYNIAFTLAQIQADMNTPVSAPGPDTQPPTAPGNLTSSAVSASQINLAWTAATDNVSIAGYQLERCQGTSCSNFAQIASPAATDTAYSDSGLTESTSYSYRLRAADGAGNLGPYSLIATTVTPAPDTTPPSATGTLSGVAVSGVEIDLAWGAATDNIGVIGYRIERCQGAGCTQFSKLGTTITDTSFQDTGLALNTSYSYMVRAQDAAGNLGPYSNVATATTLASNPQLVAAYSFNEGSGTAVADLSGHGNNGTISSATWTAAGKFGSALSFNGTTSQITINDSPSLRLTTGMTIEAWVNPTTVSSGWRDIIYKGNDNYYLAGTTSSAGRPAAGIIVGSSHVEAFGVTTLPLNTWTHLAATYDGGILRFYVNGTEVSNNPRVGSIITSANPLQIGGDSIFGQHFAGMIDEVRVYSAALKPADIQADIATALGATLPILTLSRFSIDFGTQTVGSTSAAVPVTLTNSGGAPMTLSGISITGTQSGDFAQTNNCTASIAVNASCTVNVTFRPTVAASRSASLSVSDNAPGSPHSVTLSGTGLGFSISPHSVVLTPGQTQQFTVSGPGSGSVNWSADSIAGGSAGAGFVTTSGLYTAPAAAGAHTVTVTTSDGLTASSASVFVSAHPGVLTHHNDNFRTGQNTQESVLTLADVNTTTFGKLFSYSTDGISHASPLYLPGVDVPGVGLRNVVYVATEHDSLYAFDADGGSTTPLWHISFINPAAGITTVTSTDVGECCDITPEIGITGTPVIDASTGTLYLVAKTKENGNFVQRLHALNVATGAEKFGGPVVIQGSVPGSGVGSVAGRVPFDSLRENQRTALLLLNGNVYFGFGSHGDNEPYHGWLLGYNAATLSPVLAYNATPNGEGAGIWQSGGGLVADASGNIYYVTGDGTFDVNSGGVNYGDSFVKFASGAVQDYFTPHDQGLIDTNNLDLGAGGLVLLPDQPGAHPHLLVSAGKNGSIYLVDRDNMGHYSATANTNVQTLANIFPFGTPLPGNYSSPVYFNGSVYFGPVADTVQAFQLSNGLLSTAPTSRTAVSYGYPGGALAISANGTSNGILWAVEKRGTAAGALHAYDARNLAVELYNSDQAPGGRDVIDAAAKFSIPLVVNGKVFVASEGRLTAFGLLP